MTAGKFTAMVADRQTVAVGDVNISVVELLHQLVLVTMKELVEHIAKVLEVVVDAEEHDVLVEGVGPVIAVKQLLGLR